MQFPDVVDAWYPIGNQFIDASSSTALTIPTLPATAGATIKGTAALYVAILTAQGVSCFIRTDGVAVTAAVTGGIEMFPGDWRLFYGYEAIKNVRVIRSATGGSLAAEYFFFRPTMT